ncbi:MAG: hypothetical protein SWH68_10140 [Thermodesulfobacteriota bacterium]|nr:hypothetical protein [Thermodesulfobacteriota bacterium]
MAFFRQHRAFSFLGIILNTLILTGAAVADTGNYDFSMWSWCGQVSSATPAYIDDHLNTMNQFEWEA